MASVRIEYVRLNDSAGLNGNGPINIVRRSLGSEGAPLEVTDTATAGGSRPVVPKFGSNSTTHVRLTAIGGPVYVAWGSNPTAAATGAGLRLTEEFPEVIEVNAGELMSFIVVDES